MQQNQLSQEIQSLLFQCGASDVGFATWEEPVFGPFRHSISIAVALSRPILGEIGECPTPMYFQHYRTVNAALDQLALRAGLYLQTRGYDYYPVAASQSVNTEGWNYRGAFSHKQAAVRAGMGRIGKSALFLHRKFGPGCRLATVFTSCDLGGAACIHQGCGDCRACVDACPAGAISGNDYRLGEDRETLFDPEKCSRYMKNHYQKIGRGSVCGRCIYVCMKANRLFR